MVKLLMKLFIPNSINTMFLTGRDFLNGKKTYIAASIALLQALVLIISDISTMNNITDLYTWLQSLPGSNISLLITNSLAIFGLRNALDRRV